MSQIRGTAGYNLGAQNRFSAPGRAEATNDPSPLDTIREQTNKIEDWLDTLAEPVKPYAHLFSTLPCSLASPMDTCCDAERILTRDLWLPRYLPAIGRFLIVVTFLEDALRIITQWSDQLVYLHDYRHSTYLRGHSSPITVPCTTA